MRARRDRHRRAHTCGRCAKHTIAGVAVVVVVGWWLLPLLWLRLWMWLWLWWCCCCLRRSQKHDVGSDERAAHERRAFQEAAAPVQGWAHACRPSQAKPPHDQDKCQQQQTSNNKAKPQEGQPTARQNNNKTRQKQKITRATTVRQRHTNDNDFSEPRENGHR